MENETKDLSEEEKRFLFTSMFKKIDKNIEAKENCSVVETKNATSCESVKEQEVTQNTYTVG